MFDPRVSLLPVLTDSGALAVERQNLVIGSVDSAEWSYARDDRTLVLGGAVRFRAQILGTFSDEDSSWLWVWANPHGGLSPSETTQATRLREIGETRAIEAFTRPGFTLARERLLELALAAAGALDLKAYFLGAYDAGVLLLAVDDETAPTLAAPDPLLVIKSFVAFVSSVEITDHQRACESYLRARGFEVAVDDGGLRASTGDQAIVMTFDLLGRLTGASMVARPRP